MKKIIVIIIAILLSGCNIDKYHANKCKKWNVCGTDSTSVIIKETVKHDTLTMPESTMWMDVSFECDSNRNVLIKNIDSLNTVNSNLMIKLKDNKLVMYVKVPEKQIVTDTIYINKDRYVRDVVKEDVPDGNVKKAATITGYIAWIIVILLIAYKTYRFFSK